MSCSLACPSYCLLLFTRSGSALICDAEVNCTSSCFGIVLVRVGEDMGLKRNYIGRSRQVVLYDELKLQGNGLALPARSRHLRAAPLFFSQHLASLPRRGATTLRITYRPLLTLHLSPMSTTSRHRRYMYSYHGSSSYCNQRRQFAHRLVSGLRLLPMAAWFCQSYKYAPRAPRQNAYFGALGPKVSKYDLLWVRLPGKESQSHIPIPAS